VKRSNGRSNRHQRAGEQQQNRKEGGNLEKSKKGENKPSIPRGNSCCEKDKEKTVSFRTGVGGFLGHKKIGTPTNQFLIETEKERAH